MIQTNFSFGLLLLNGYFPFDRLWIASASQYFGISTLANTLVGRQIIIESPYTNMAVMMEG